MTLFSAVLLFLLLLETMVLLYVLFLNKVKEEPKRKQKTDVATDQVTVVEAPAKTFSPGQHTILLAGRLASAAEMIPTAVHDIRQPLSVLCGYLDLLTLHDKKDSEVEDYLKSCSESTMRLESYVSKLREYARYDKEHTLVPIKLVPRIERAEELLSEKIQKMHVRIVKDFPEKEPEVLFSNQDCILLFHHLLSNALDAVIGVPEPQLDFSIRCEKHKVIFTMRDNGCGITDEVLKNCFSPLYTTKEWGTGLGLPFCRAVLQKIEGSIVLMPNENNAPGCSVRLVFPDHGGH